MMVKQTYKKRKRKIDNGELKTVKNTRGKTNFWAAFQVVTTLSDEPTGYAQCTTCKAVLSYDSKKTGSYNFQRHLCVEDVADQPAAAYKCV